MKNLAKEVPTDNVALLSGKTVLIVDDNKINQLVTQKVLDLLSMKYSTAGDGKQAITMAQNNNYDFILMDINMPVMNGIIATQEIRKFDNFTPIVALTATLFDNPDKEIYCHGFNAIIVKPYRTDQLVRTFLDQLSYNSPI